MAIKIRDFSFPAGTNFGFMIQWKRDGVPVDVSEWTAKAEIRSRRDGQLMATFTVTKSTTPDDGTLTVELAPDDSLGLVGDDCDYSLIVVKGSQVIELVRGRLYIGKRITVP